MGLAAIMAAVVAAASVIIAVDVNEQRLALAREFGATHTINLTTSDVGQELKTITGRGVNYVFDTSGRKEMLGHAVNGLAPLGQVGLVASAGSDGTVEVSKLILGSLVRGIVQGDAIPQLFIPELIRLYKAGQFPFDRLVRFFPFEQINEAFAAAASGEVIKPILRKVHALTRDPGNHLEFPRTVTRVTSKLVDAWNRGAPHIESSEKYLRYFMDFPERREDLCAQRRSEQRRQST